MKRRTLQWNVFLVANFVQLICFFFLLLAIILFYIQVQGLGRSDSIIIRRILVTAGLLFVIINSIVNIHIALSCFPDKALTKGLKSMTIVFGIIDSLVILFILVLVAEAIYDELNGKYRPTVGLRAEPAALYFSGSIGLLGIYILIMQFRMNPYLKRRQKESINSVIESIGTN